MSASDEAIPGHSNLDADFCDDDSSSFVSDCGTRHWIPKCPDEFKPRIGMVFQHVNDAITFYKNYAYIAGFSVRLSITSTRSDGVLTHKYLVCSKEGFKGKHALVDTVSMVEQSERHRRDSRCGCYARMCLNISDGGVYCVYSFEEAHNHWLVDDIGKQYLNQNRQLSVVHQNIIMHCGKYRIGATKAHHLVKDLCGGFSNVGATIIDFKNFKRDLKLYIGLNDAQMIVDSLMNKKNTCKCYSFEYFVDEHGSLSRLFWADHVARGDCIIFGDVVSFDATYRINKYNLVFVPFTGVDNHHRIVTLAAGLISKEDVESYTWLLTCFKNFVVRDPSVIVTDQDATMKVAISRVFPTSRHRFYMWHITEKLQSKVGISKYREPGFFNSIKGVIWDDYTDPKEFEERWLEMIIKYDLQCNSWLADMYKLRGFWTPIYFHDVTMGGLLRTTSRSESENSFFGRYIYGFMTLVEFFTSFNNAMDLQRNIRVHLYIESRSSSPFIQSKHILEKHASEIFTKSILKKIQLEIASHICGIQMMTDNEDGKMYTIYDTERGDKTFQPTEVLVNNPGISQNKGSDKRVKGPREIVMDKLKKPQRLCGYCNDRGTHDKRTCPKRLLDEARLHESTAEPDSAYDAAFSDIEHTQFDLSHNS
ncbi:hypothetical protein QQ045_018487 [Rhodiola kirilowii]